MGHHRTVSEFLSYPIQTWPPWTHLLDHPRPLLSLTLPLVLHHSICSSTCPGPTTCHVSPRAGPSEDCAQPTVSSKNTGDQPQAGFQAAFLFWLICVLTCFPRLLPPGPSHWQHLAQNPGYRREQSQPKHCPGKRTAQRERLSLRMSF